MCSGGLLDIQLYFGEARLPPLGIIFRSFKQGPVCIAWIIPREKFEETNFVKFLFHSLL